MSGSYFDLSKADFIAEPLALLWTRSLSFDAPMSSVSRLSHPFHLPVLAIWNLLLPLICLNVLVVYLHDMACPCDFAVTFV